MVRKFLVGDDYEETECSSLRLKKLFTFTVEEAISFFAYRGCLTNEMICDKCDNKMNVQKANNFPDGIKVGFFKSKFIVIFSGFVETTSASVLRSQLEADPFLKILSCRYRSLFSYFTCGLTILTTSKLRMNWKFRQKQSLTG